MIDRLRSRLARRWVHRAAAAGAAAALGLWFLWQQNGLEVHREEVFSPRLPAAFDGLRIVHLSDLHGKQFGQNSERLLQAVAALEPDLIAITGDLIDREEQLDMAAPLAEGLAAIAPTYYVTGNHEWAARCVNDLEQLLTQCGVQVLRGSYQVWEKEGQTLAVVGVDDPNGPAEQITGPELLEDISADYVLLLAHRDAVETYSQWGYDLVLCGHGHGGIFRIPLWDQGLLSSDNTLFPAYDGGLYPLESGGWCYVSRGLGSNTTPIRAFRLFNRPDLPLLILRTADSAG